MNNQRIGRHAFLHATAGHELETRDVALDPRLAGAHLEEADTNADGVIRGERELDALFDKLTRSPPRRRHRRAAASRTMLAGVADEMHAPRLRAMIHRPERARYEAVLALGMNDASEAEVAALRQHADVLFIGDVPSRRDLVRAAGGALDLADPAQVGRFVNTLPLLPMQRIKLRALLLRVRPGARRELGVLAGIWSMAEAGGTVPSRLMLSGHGDHRSIFGEHQERIDDADIAQLARLMPIAAAQIHSLHLAACQHGYEPRMAPFLDVFPNLDSAWGYAGFSPTGRPAQRHQAIWERETRGLPAGGGVLRRSMAQGTRRGDAVRVWTRARGFDGPPLRELHSIHVEVEDLRPLYDDLLAGRVQMNDARYGRLTRLYGLLQEITAHGDFQEQSDDYRVDRTEMRAAALRLRFYPAVASHFARAHGAAIQRGYAALGLTPPDFSQLNRHDAMRAIGDLSARVDETSPAISRSVLRRLRRGLAELGEEEIPTQWIEGR